MHSVTSTYTQTHTISHTFKCVCVWEYVYEDYDIVQFKQLHGNIMKIEK